MVKKYKPTNDKLRDKLKNLREKIGSPVQEVIAKEIGVSLTTICNWESGTTKLKADNMKMLIAVYLRKGAFTQGQELRRSQTTLGDSGHTCQFRREMVQ